MPTLRGWPGLEANISCRDVKMHEYHTAENLAHHDDNPNELTTNIRSFSNATLVPLLTFRPGFQSKIPLELQEEGGIMLVIRNIANQEKEAATSTPAIPLLFKRWSQGHSFEKSMPTIRRQNQHWQDFYPYKFLPLVEAQHGESPTVTSPEQGLDIELYFMKCSGIYETGSIGCLGKPEQTKNNVEEVKNTVRPGFKEETGVDNTVGYGDRVNTHIQAPWPNKKRRPSLRIEPLDPGDLPWQHQDFAEMSKEAAERFCADLLQKWEAVSKNEKKRVVDLITEREACSCSAGKGAEHHPDGAEIGLPNPKRSTQSPGNQTMTDFQEREGMIKSHEGHENADQKLKEGQAEGWDVMGGD
ncbi:MAG: hypothetical protein M1831_007270 [Alyxoria varia]|nr:MAG: hypothetical protein M1831_007270 [Alyxoria varia]